MRFFSQLVVFALIASGWCSHALGQQPTQTLGEGSSQSSGDGMQLDAGATVIEDPSSTLDGATDWYHVEPTGSQTPSGYSTIGGGDQCGPDGFCGSCGDSCFSGCGKYDGMRMCRFDLAYISSDLLFLGRDADNFRIVGTDGAAQSFDESLSHGFEPGFRINLGLRLWGNGFLEARHAMAGGWSARGDFQPLPADPAAIAAQGVFEADYFSTDLNLVAEDPINQEYQLLLGLRYIEHGDSFATTLSNSQAPPDVENYFGSADNSMFGIQAGIRTGWFYRRSVWKLSLIGGVLNNQIKQRGPRYASALLLDGVADPVFSLEDDEVSIFADIEGSIAYPICRSTFVRVGYQGIFMDNAVTVTQQAGAPASADAIEFHGGFVGLEYYR